MAHCMNEALKHEWWVVKGKRIKEDSATTGGGHQPSKKPSNQPLQALQDKLSGKKNPQPRKTNTARSSASDKRRPAGNGYYQCRQRGYFKRECP